MPKTIDISVVVPVYNEADNLPELDQQIRSALADSGLRYEVLLVDDGSKDGSREIIRKLADADPRVKGILFRRNFGQTAAMQAGFDHAVGQVLVPMDADLQNDPIDIPRLVAKLDEGFDIVSGWRAERKEGVIRRIPSKIANNILRNISGVDIHDTGCTLKAYRRETLEPVRLYGQLHRFIPALASAYGARITELPVTHHPRIHGESKYGIGRTTKVILDLMLLKFLLVSLTRPIHAFGRWALLSFGISAICLLVGLGQLLFGEQAAVWLVAGLVLLTLGWQLIGTGVVAELLTRVYHEGTGRQTYRVLEVVGQTAEEVTS